MDISLLLFVAVRAIIVYVFLFTAVRLLGKRKLGIHSAFDLVVAIIMANLASEAIFGTVTLFHGLFAIATIAAVHFTGYYFSARNTRLQRLINAEPVVLIRDGEILVQALKAEHLPEADLWSLLRRQVSICWLKSSWRSSNPPGISASCVRSGQGSAEG